MLVSPNNKLDELEHAQSTQGRAVLSAMLLASLCLIVQG